MTRRIYFCSFCTCLISVILFLASDLLGQKTIPEVANTSRYVGKGQWDWKVYINAPDKILHNIKCVEYHLPRTFPNSIRTECELGNPLYPFGHSTHGWGTFKISVKIIYKKGRPIELEHTLKFESLEVDEPLQIGARSVAYFLGEGLWEWTVFIRGSEEALEQIQLVEYTLHPDFRDNIQEVLERGSRVRAFPLSGISSRAFQIRIRVFLKNGRFQYRDHDLKFWD